MRDTENVKKRNCFFQTIYKSFHRSYTFFLIHEKMFYKNQKFHFHAIIYNIQVKLNFALRWKAKKNENVLQEMLESS